MPAPAGTEIPLLAGMKWLPDESLYSLVARYHRFSLAGKTTDTVRALFEINSGILRTDIPMNVGTIAARAAGALGSWDSIVHRRTIIPFLLHFTNTASSNRLLDLVKSEEGQYSNHPFTVIRGRTPLRICIRCQELDFELRGHSYWRIHHQYPGVLICVTHKLWLRSAREGGGNHARLSLPNLNAVARKGIHSALPETVGDDDLAMRFSGASIAMSRLPLDFRFDLGMVQRCYLRRLQAKGRLGVRGQIRRLENEAELKQLICELTNPIVDRSLSAFINNRDMLASGCVRLVRDLNPNTNPIRHLLLIVWLFGTWNQFFSAYEDETRRQGRLFD